MKLTLLPCTFLLFCIHSSSGAFWSSWAAGGGGGPPTTVAPGPCGIGALVVNGTQNATTDAALGQVAWQVSVMSKGVGATWRHACGGALIGKQAVLTSASCVDGLNAGFVRIEGGIIDLPKGGFVRRRRFTYPGQLTPGLAYTEKVVAHPDYNKATGQNNLAVLRLATGLDFAKSDGKLNQICYPELPLASGSVTEQLFVSGWGAVKEDATLRGKLQLKPVEMVDCTVYRNDNEFCAAQQEEDGGECEGDNGGPIFTENGGASGSQLIGITSRGSTCSKASPMIYTEVYPYLEWIKDAAKPYY